MPALTLDALTALLQPIFLAHGASTETAAILAANCAAAERDGAHSHGVFRMPGYVATLDSQWADGRAIPAVQDAAAGFIRVDARNGFAQPALAAARGLAMAKLRTAGVCVVAIHTSHHLGALSLDVEPFAQDGILALSMVNSMAAAVPFGATRKVFGTNPLAMAAPRTGAPPIVFDMATSAIAHGDVQLAAREGRRLPPGTGLDRTGAPTQDPAAILHGGALLPFGGHKGSAIAMMVELFGAALTGGKFSFEMDLAAHPGAHTPRTGQLLILIDPSAGLGPLAPFADRATQLVTELHSAGQQRLPGDRRLQARAQALANGITLTAETLATLQALAQPPGQKNAPSRP